MNSLQFAIETEGDAQNAFADYTKHNEDTGSSDIIEDAETVRKESIEDQAGVEELSVNSCNEEQVVNDGEEMSSSSSDDDRISLVSLSSDG